MALEQTRGRGQRGRQWFARNGESLSATYMVYSSRLTDPVRSQNIGLLAGVSLAEVVARRCPEVSVGLKWPNDLMLNSRKAGGILVEMVASPVGDRVALIGVGVNVAVREFPDDLADAATSMTLEGIAADRLPNLRTLAEEIGAELATQVEASHVDTAACIRRWRQFDATTGRRFETRVGDSTVSGVAEGIDDTGALLLRMDGGSLQPVTSATSLRELHAR